MSASPESLHLIAHRASAKPRDASDWWGSAIETGLAAVAATCHSGAHREQAEGAVDSLSRWQRGGHLLGAAISAVDAIAHRTSHVVPEMHIALAAWALDDLVADRDAAPWPALRDRVTRGSAYGVDAALRSYAACTAAQHFDAGGLVQSLITQTPLSPGPNDATIVLWLLGAGIDRCSQALARDEPGLRALVERRASITERLALELDESTFTAPDVGGFDPDASLDETRTTYLSPMEALLLDSTSPSLPRIRTKRG